jgi:hypothetical protein
MRSTPKKCSYIKRYAQQQRIIRQEREEEDVIEMHGILDTLIAEGYVRVIRRPDGETAYEVTRWLLL